MREYAETETVAQMNREYEQKEEAYKIDIKELEERHEALSNGR